MRDSNVSVFGLKLSEIERHFLGNVKKTKSVFPDETTAIERGLALMFDLTADLNDAVRKNKEPNLYANRSLFARNRQLLLNAYFCMLCSNYGTQFVILRTVLENNDLMRLFNLHPQYAYWWLSSETQKQFPSEIQAKYGKSGKHDIEFGNSWVRNNLFKEIKKEKVAKNIKEIYGELCDYTHPNFKGWQELMGSVRKEEVLMKMPAFAENNIFEAIGLSLLLMQMSFKTVVETFRFSSLFAFFSDLARWQNTSQKLMTRYGS